MRQVQRAALRLLHKHTLRAIREAEAFLFTMQQQQQQEEEAGAGLGASGSGRPVLAQPSAASGMDASSVVQLLNGAVQFAFKCHQFAGGFDSANIQSYERLDQLWHLFKPSQTATSAS